uniref:Kinesin-like protein n=1 Tax=Marsilea vestita TaxID=59764 RepID=A0A142KWB1_MARVE|nr:kinesin 8-IIb protein [Marsilea vestita]
MPAPSRSKSFGNVHRMDIPGREHSSSYMEGQSSSIKPQLSNLRSLSRGRFLTRAGREQFNESRRNSNSASAKPCASHESIDLLSSARTTNPLIQRRQTLAAFPKKIELATEDDATSVLKINALNIGDNVNSSPHIVGGYQYKSSARSYKSRNSLDNADVAKLKPRKKLTLDPTQECTPNKGHSDRIRVYVRIRPISKKEKEVGARCCVKAANGKEIYLTEMALESDYLRLKRLKGRYFIFDGAFPENTNQEEVYRTSTEQLVEAVLEGKNSSVFCYGATGAGKTFTMLGTMKDPGVMVLALKDLFAKLKQRSSEGEHSVRLSYLEVYNETVRDLLSPGRALVLREDLKQGIVAAGLTQYKACSADEVMALLQQGNQNRTTEPTRLNETSSRSHAILQIFVEYSARVGVSLVSRTGKLSLIDLAGSERAIATDQRTLRSLEGANINRSLLALSSCISALVEGKKHIPFRNSKLTQLLKDSLGGSCQTAMIANISPSNMSFGETQNTLYWADRAKEIRTKGCVTNEEIQVPESGCEQLQLLLEVQKENHQLRMQVAQLQQKLIAFESHSLVSKQDGFADVKMTSPTSTLKPALNANQKENIEESDIKHQVRCDDLLFKIPNGFSSAKATNLMIRSPLTPSQDPYLCFHSTSRDHCRKRTFWDITNANSPYDKSACRNIKSNTATTGSPSMLMQPGFLGRRRLKL